MDVPAGSAHVLPDVLDERDHVVMPDGLDLLDPGDVESGLLLDLGEVLDGHLPEAHPRFDGQHLDLRTSSLPRGAVTATYLLTDADTKVARAYGAYKDTGEEFEGIPLKIKRSTFVIDENGKLASAEYGVRVKGHVEALKEAVGIAT